MRLFLVLVFLLASACAAPLKEEHETAPAVAPGLPRETISQTVRQHLPDLNSCYTKALESKPGISGKLVLQWQIRDQGKVANVRVVKGLFEPLDDCVATKVENWTFPPAPPGSAHTRVVYPFTFSEGE